MTIPNEDQIAQPPTPGQVESALREFLSIWGEPSDKEVKEWLPIIDADPRHVRRALMGMVHMLKSTEAELSEGMILQTRLSRNLITSVAEKYGVKAEHILSDDRSRKVSHARFAAITSCAEAGYSRAKLCRIFSRDGATIDYALRRHKVLNGIK